MTRRLEGRVALVTGASRGLGASAAVALAKEGAHIIATARTEGGLTELDDAIRRSADGATAGARRHQGLPAIDRLGARDLRALEEARHPGRRCRRAGQGHTRRTFDPKVWDEVMAVNVTANYRLIRSMDPLLRQSDAGRAVFLVTSGLAHKCWAYWGPTSISKAALEAMVKTYAAETRHDQVRANCFSPGATRTSMRASAMPGEDPMSLPHPDEVAAQIDRRCASRRFSDNGGMWKYAPEGLFKQFCREVSRMSDSTGDRGLRRRPQVPVAPEPPA